MKIKHKLINFHIIFFEISISKPKINYIDMPQGLKDKYQYFTQADMSKLRTAGYNKPMTELEEGIEKYILDHLAKADKYR